MTTTPTQLNQKQTRTFADGNKIHRVTPEHLELLEEVVVELLYKQPLSYEPQRNIETMLKLIESGHLICYLFLDEKDYTYGMMCLSISSPSSNVTKATVEFVSCKFFHRMATMYRIIERMAVEFGCDYIDGIAHPTIAKYCINKLGFSTSGVYLQKPLMKQRMN